jgi:hypothetical protein
MFVAPTLKDIEFGPDYYLPNRTSLLPQMLNETTLLRSALKTGWSGDGSLDDWLHTAPEYVQLRETITKLYGKGFMYGEPPSKVYARCVRMQDADVDKINDELFGRGGK